MKEIQQDFKKSRSLACKQREATPISNHYTSSRSLCGNVPISLTIRRPVSASSASNGDITDMMQHMETSEGRTLPHLGSAVMRETITLTSPLLSEPHSGATVKKTKKQKQTNKQMFIISLRGSN